MGSESEARVPVLDRLIFWITRRRPNDWSPVRRAGEITNRLVAQQVALNAAYTARVAAEIDRKPPEDTAPNDRN